MATATQQQTFNQQGFDDFLATRSEPDWVVDDRRKAWNAFQEMSWPGRSEEEWIRTDIRLFKLDRFAPPCTAEADSVSEDVTTGGLLCPGVALGGRTASLNSSPVASHLNEKWTEKGVLFGSMEEILRQHGDRVRPYLNRAFDSRYDRFAALHAAFWSSGQVLFVPRGVVVDEPLHSRSTISDGGVDFGHTLVILEDGAEATLLCEQGSPDEETKGLHCGAIELIVGPRAHLRFVNLQDWGRGVWHFAHQKALVDKDASLQWTTGAMGARLAKVNQRVELIGPGATSQVNGAMFTEDKQHLAYHTQQHHVAPDCHSDFLYKTALQDKSRTVWRGMIRVDKAAQKTDGYQRNDNLLLTPDARADSIPGLEIEADDVRCTHGSTSGRVDDELIFYARCRGYTRKEAVQMIVTGFFQQIFDRITIENVRDALGLAIARRVREYD